MKTNSKVKFLALLSVFLLATSTMTVDAKRVKATEPSPTPTTTTVAPKMTLGYYTVYYTGDKGSYNSLNNFGSYMNAISTVTFNINATGGVTGTAPTDGLTLATNKSVKAFACIQNEINGTFDANTTHNVLIDPALRQNVINNALNIVKTNGYKGVNLDFENMLASDRPYYSQFVRDLSNAMTLNGFSTIVSVTAKTSDSPTAAWSGTFDYAALGQAADNIQIMTYDEHGSWGTPGPVASLPWVENVVKYAVSQMPSTKILLGLPAYGYDWNTTTNTGNKAVAWKNIPSLLTNTGATPQWDAVKQSPYFYYTDSTGNNHTVWYENSQSIQAKTKLVNTYNLGGTGMWRMGLEDVNFWTAVKTGLGQ